MPLRANEILNGFRNIFAVSQSAVAQQVLLNKKLDPLLGRFPDGLSLPRLGTPDKAVRGNVPRCASQLTPPT